MPHGNVLQPLQPTRHPTSSEEWEDYRETIQRLYILEDRSLPEVIDGVAQIFGFVATERQYKRRISEWGLDKNVKDDEVRAIVSEQASRLRQGKASVFYVRNRRVDPKKIKRFVRRKQINRHMCTEDILGRLPPGIRCTTPPSNLPTIDTPLPHHARCDSYTSDVFPAGRPRSDFEERAPSYERKTNLSNAAIGYNPSQTDRNPTMMIMPEEKRRKKRKRVDLIPSVSLSTESSKVPPSLPSPLAPGRHATISTLLSGSVFDLDDGDTSSSSTYTGSPRHGRPRSLLPDTCLRAKRSHSGYVSPNSIVGDVSPDCEHVGKELSAKEISLQKNARFSELLDAARDAHIADFESTAGERSPFVLASPFARMPKLSDHKFPPTVRLEDCVVLPGVRPEYVALDYDKRAMEGQERVSLYSPNDSSRGTCDGDRVELTRINPASHDSTTNLHLTLSDICQDELYESSSTTSALSR
ncbi:MAG: hypothetical protein Q9184_006113 [Pyrenodesmia sp. 2 TL-2023]